MTFSQILHGFSAFIGLFTLAIGIFACLLPAKMSKVFGIAASGSALPYVISTGVRDIFMGLVILAIFFFQAWNVMVVASFALGVVALSDFLVVLKHGDRKIALSHLVGVVGIVTYGCLLWFLGT